MKQTKEYHIPTMSITQFYGIPNICNVSTDLPDTKYEGESSNLTDEERAEGGDAADRKDWDGRLWDETKIW